MATIADVLAREILDSRGNPTVEVEVMLDDDTTARAAKRSALFEYRSQMDVMPRLLKSFLRRNEIWLALE